MLIALKALAKVKSKVCTEAALQWLWGGLDVGFGN